MIQKTVLTADDMAGMISAIWEYNKRGQPLLIGYYDQQGNVLPVALVEVSSDEPGLAVRSRPEDTLTPAQVAQQLSQVAGDSSMSPVATPMADLAAALESLNGK
jgi:hypothetical protein